MEKTLDPAEIYQEGKTASNSCIARLRIWRDCFLVLGETAVSRIGAILDSASFKADSTIFSRDGPFPGLASSRAVSSKRKGSGDRAPTTMRICGFSSPGTCRGIADGNVGKGKVDGRTDAGLQEFPPGPRRKMGNQNSFEDKSSLHPGRMIMDDSLKGKGLRSFFVEDFGGRIEGEQNRGEVRIIKGPADLRTRNLMTDPSAKLEAGGDIALARSRSG